MGSLVLLGLSPGSPLHCLPTEPSLLVALGSSGPGGVCDVLSVRKGSFSRCQFPTVLPSLVPHSGRLRDGTARIPGQFRNPHDSRPLLEVGALRGAPQTAIRQEDRSAPGPACLQAPWTTPGGDVQNFGRRSVCWLE